MDYNNDDDYIDNWSNLPGDLIKTITRYINPYFKPELRLINSHWQKFIVPQVIYSTNETRVNDLDYLSIDYKNIITNLIIGKTENNEMNKQVYQRLTELKATSLEYYLDLEAGLKWLNLIIKNFKKIQFINLVSYNSNSRLNWKEFNNSLVDLKDLIGFRFSIEDGYLLPTLQTLPLLNLYKLVLELNSNQLSLVFGTVKQMKKLRHLELTIEYPEVENGEYEITFHSINELLKVGNFYNLQVTSNYNDREYYWNDVTSSSQLRDEIMDLLGSPNLKSLKSFDWRFWLQSPSLIQDVFNNPIDLTCPPLVNLTKLNLITMDKYLLSLIIKNFPNLIEFGFDSPLPIPHIPIETTLKPLKYLKRLKFKGFYSNLKDHSQLIHELFPNVATLCLTDYSEISNTISTNSYFISLLFPKLKFLLFKSTNYKFYDIDDSGISSLTWENLYLELDFDNKYILDFVIRKLEGLRFLYLSSSSLNLNRVKLSDKPNGLKVFLCESSNFDGCDFDIKIDKELN